MDLVFTAIGAFILGFIVGAWADTEGSPCACSDGCFNPTCGGSCSCHIDGNDNCCGGCCERPATT